MSIFKDVRMFGIKFGIPRAELPVLLPKKEMEGRINFLREELIETVIATDADDIKEVIDGLIDIIYVAAGTLDQMGVDSQAHWDEVHQCNMSKVSGPTMRGMKHDVSKPAGWTPPNHQRILDN